MPAIAYWTFEKFPSHKTTRNVCKVDSTRRRYCFVLPRGAENPLLQGGLTIEEKGPGERSGGTMSGTKGDTARYCGEKENPTESTIQFLKLQELELLKFIFKHVSCCLHYKPYWKEKNEYEKLPWYKI